MGLTRYQKPQIVVAISDLEIGETVIKRKARFDSLVYAQNSQGGNPQDMFRSGSNSPELITVNLTIQSFAKNADGSYGEPLEGKPGFSSYQHRLIADNSTVVDAVTGEVLGTAAEYALTANVVEGGKFFGKEVMYENERFRQMAENVPVKVDEIIIQYIQAASAAGRFNS